VALNLLVVAHNHLIIESVAVLEKIVTVRPAAAITNDLSVATEISLLATGHTRNRPYLDRRVMISPHRRNRILLTGRIANMCQEGHMWREGIIVVVRMIQTTEAVVVAVVVAVAKHGANLGRDDLNSEIPVKHRLT
jgi:hypothetical protein